GRRLREVSRSARVSLGYLSEVERGQKEASSDLLAAICEALELPLSELLYNVASDVAAMDAMELESQEGSRQPENKGEVVKSGENVALRTTISSPGMQVFVA